MRIIIATLWRTVILLVCSIIQVFAVITHSIGSMFVGFSDILMNASGGLLNSLDKGKYESEMKAIVE